MTIIFRVVGPGLIAFRLAGLLLAPAMLWLIFGYFYGWQRWAELATLTGFVLAFMYLNWTGFIMLATYYEIAVITALSTLAVYDVLVYRPHRRATARASAAQTSADCPTEECVTTLLPPTHYPALTAPPPKLDCRAAFWASVRKELRNMPLDALLWIVLYATLTTGTRYGLY